MSTQILNIYSDGEPGKLFEFIPYREYFTRQVTNGDSIERFSFVIDENDTMYGIALRKSKQIDLYHNYSLVSESDNLKFKSIETNFWGIYA